jgi:hypothetical protein
MAKDGAGQTPAGATSAEQFYDQDKRRATSRDLSYGSAWKLAGWSDETHVVELYWLGATHELVACYVVLDWSRVSLDERKTSGAEMLGEAAGSGAEIGHVLRVLDEAAAATSVEVLAHLDSDLECHEVMWVAPAPTPPRRPGTHPQQNRPTRFRRTGLGTITAPGIAVLRS